MMGQKDLGFDGFLSFNLDGTASVRTATAGTLRAFLEQRARWGAKSTRYRMPDIQILALLVALTTLSIFLFPMWIALYPALWPCFLGAWIAKTGMDFLLLYRTAVLTGHRDSLKYFLPAALAYYPVYLVLFIRMVFRPPAWKGKGIR